jgi:hypothetical protein
LLGVHEHTANHHSFAHARHYRPSGHLSSTLDLTARYHEQRSPHNHLVGLSAAKNLESHG